MLGVKFDRHGVLQMRSPDEFPGCLVNLKWWFSVVGHACRQQPGAPSLGIASYLHRLSLQVQGFP